MKKLAFTIAFGPKKYTNMARALQESISRYSPGIEFRIFDDSDITPYEQALPNDRKLHPKDYKYPKLEIMSKMQDPDTRYMYIDADAFVFGDISPYFDLIDNDELMIEYVYNGSNGWAGINKFQFIDRCEEAGLPGLEPYSINSGFIVWQGKQQCFETALKLILDKTLNDLKGRKGDEYYLCAGIQLSKTRVKPINYDVVKLGKLWNGDVSYKDGMLACTAYPNKDLIIQHYGNNNYNNPAIQKVLQDFGLRDYSFKQYLVYLGQRLKKLVRKL